jgi:hypothetical protein
LTIRKEIIGNIFNYLIPGTGGLSRAMKGGFEIVPIQKIK